MEIDLTPKEAEVTMRALYQVEDMWRTAQADLMGSNVKEDRETVVQIGRDIDRLSSVMVKVGKLPRESNLPDTVSEMFPDEH